MMLQPGVICPAVRFYDAGGYTLTMCGIIEAYVGTYILRKNRSRMTGS